MTDQTRKSRQMRLNTCVLNRPKRIQTAGNLRNNACKHREAAKPADAANAELENNGKIRQLHPNTKIIGKYRFKVASKPLAKQITPHAAKHCIGCLSVDVCKGVDEHKAWSMNMGHGGEDVTNIYKRNIRSYKNMSEEHVFEIFDQLDREGENVGDFVIEDKDLMLGYLLRDFVPGTDEYERGEDLVDEHRERKKARRRK